MPCCRDDLKARTCEKFGPIGNVQISCGIKQMESQNVTQTKCLRVGLVTSSRDRCNYNLFLVLTISMIKSFPLNWKHRVCLGATQSLESAWSKSGHGVYRHLSSASVDKLGNRVSRTHSSTSSDFRSLSVIPVALGSVKPLNSIGICKDPPFAVFLCGLQYPLPNPFS